MVFSSRVKSDRLQINLLELFSSLAPLLHALINLPKLFGKRLIFLQHCTQLHVTEYKHSAVNGVLVFFSAALDFPFGWSLGFEPLNLFVSGWAASFPFSLFFHPERDRISVSNMLSQVTNASTLFACSCFQLMLC